jgi:hypothetical protein
MTAGDLHKTGLIKLAQSTPAGRRTINEVAWLIYRIALIDGIDAYRRSGYE